MYSCYTHFGKTFFNHAWMLNVVKCFICIYWDKRVFCLLYIWWIMLVDLCMLNHHCDLGMNYIWSWYMITFMHCWIWFANILLRIFASIFIKECNFLFSWCLYLVFISGWWWIHINRMLLGVFSLLQFFGRVWEGSVKVCMFGRPVKPFGLGFLFAVWF